MALPDAGDIARMERIIARLRSYGVEVREMPGWRTRGFRFPSVPVHIFDHHDASSRKSGEWGALGLILDGTPRGIPGPLSNFQVARCLDNVPKVAIVAAGYSYHAGSGGPYGSMAKNNANPVTYGTEKANDGIGEPYTEAANYAANALFHAAAVESGRVPESFPVGHKEWAPGRKSDPLYSMTDRRRQVGTFTPKGDDLPTPSDVWQMPIPDFPAMAEKRVGPDGKPVTTIPAAFALAHSLRVIDLLWREMNEIKQRLNTAPAVTTSGGVEIDYGRLITGLADEMDRRARDGRPETGPTS